MGAVIVAATGAVFIDTMRAVIADEPGAATRADVNSRIVAFGRRTTTGGVNGAGV